MTDGITEASEELEKYEKLIKQLEGQQESAQVFLNMKHFTFHTDPKVTRYARYIFFLYYFSPSPFLFGTSGLHMCKRFNCEMVCLEAVTRVLKDFAK